MSRDGPPHGHSSGARPNLYWTRRPQGRHSRVGKGGCAWRCCTHPRRQGMAKFKRGNSPSPNKDVIGMRRTGPGIGWRATSRKVSLPWRGSRSCVLPRPLSPVSSTCAPHHREGPDAKGSAPRPCHNLSPEDVEVHFTRGLKVWILSIILPQVKPHHQSGSKPNSLFCKTPNSF